MSKLIKPIKLLYALVLLSGLAFAGVDTASPKIITSDNDDRLYRYIVLPNQMEALLISDPQTDKAAVSLDVKVGSGDDPIDRPGLAHFLEHMLFLGTKKYPEADAYGQYIDAHSGKHNAFTSLEHTNFHFDIDPKFLDSAMDRFAQFFIEPMMDAKYVERERNAVNAEFRARIQDEGRRAWDVYREIFNPANSSATYGVGNLETLADRENDKAKDDLLAFYQKNYSANEMSLVVLGKNSLDELQAAVTKHFSPVKNKQIQNKKAEEPLFVDAALPAKLYIKPIQEQRELSLLFPIPPFEQYYLEKPVEYIAYLLGHEGEGSLLYVWKGRGWVESLSAGASIANEQSAAFSLSMALTEEGYKHIDEMIGEAFQMITRLRNEGVERWRYNEQGVIQSSAFRYQEKGDALSYVTALANNLHYYPPQDVIQGPVLNQRFDEELISRYLSYLTQNNVLVEISAPDVPVAKTSRYYQTDYQFKKISQQEVDAWRKQPQSLDVRLPQANEFVAKNFNIKRTLKSKDTAPRLLRTESNIRLWHIQDQTFGVPRSGIMIYARSELSAESVRGSALTDVFVSLLNRHMNSFQYFAGLAGMSLAVSPGSRGITLTVDGFSDKQGLLLSRALDSVAAPVFSQQDVDKVKEELLRDLQNKSMQAPYSQLFGVWTSLLSFSDYENSAYQQEIAKIDLKDIQEFSQKWLRSINADVLIYGNVTDSDALKLSAIVESKLFLDGKLHADPQAKYVNLPASSQARLYVFPVDHPDTATFHYFQGLDDSIDEQARMSLLAQILRADFSNDLRTEQQLGYIVGSGYYPMARVPGLGFIVQSTTRGAVEINAAVDKFLGESAGRLAHMPAEIFEQHRTALLHILNESPKSMSEQGARWWKDINYKYANFDQRQQLINAVSAIKQKTFSDYYWKTLLAPQKKELLIVAEPEKKTLDEKWLKGFERIEDVSTFKKDKNYFMLK